MPSIRAPRHGLVFLGLLLVVLAAKLPVVSTPHLWDEMNWIGFAYRLADRGFWEMLPGPHLAAYRGRPPGLFAVLAVLSEAFGRSIQLSHLLVNGFAVLGAYFTYRLADLLYGPTAGIMAALFLLADAMYFAQSAMFLGDLPTAALGVACVYFGVAGRWAAYLACALWVLFVKETAAAVVVAFCVYRVAWIERPTRIGRAMRSLFRWGAPLLVLGAYYAAKKVTAGTFVIGFDPFHSSVAQAAAQMLPITRWLFVEQHRWVFSLLVALDVLLAGPPRRELVLFALIVVCSGYSFAALYFLPRYLLPVAPYLYVAAAGALVDLVRAPSARVAIAVAILAFQVAGLDGGPRSGTREWSMAYLGVVRTHRAACAYVENRFPHARVVAPWPIWGYLTRPELGYVTRRLDAVAPGALDPPGRTDLVILDSMDAIDRARLARYVRDHRLALVHQVEEDGVWCGVYGAAPAGGPPS